MVVSGSRLVPPPFPADEVAVAAPPAVPQAAGGLTMMVPLLAVIVMLGMGLLAWSPGSAPRAPTSLMFPGMMLASALGMLAQHAVRRGAAELDDNRRRYLDHLGALAEKMCQVAAAQRDSLIWTHPDPAALWTLVGGPRTFERAPSDNDFGHVRVGVGVQRVSRRLVLPPTPPAHRLDPASVAMLRRFVQVHGTVEATPVAVALRGVPAVSVAGDPEPVRDLLRAMVCQLAVLHDPRDLRIAAVVGTGCRGQWDWLKWLPHNDHPRRGSMFYDTLDQAAAALADVSVEGGAFDPVAAPSHPHAVIIVDGPDSTASPALRPGIAAVTILAVGQDGPAGGLRLRIDGDRLAVLTGSGDEVIAVADGLAEADARVCARRLARHRPPEGASAADPLHRWCAELGIGGEGWVRHDERDRLRVPIGTAAQGGLVELDIKEAAEGGHGPHGLCVGATGSGKSELLRTVVLGMVVRHPPEELNLVLIDFKGGATFLSLDALHHVAAVITNLSEESHLVARMKDALGGEIHRRQQLLRRAGVASARSYRQRSRTDPSLPALPSLLVVIDEFAELLQQHADFVELFGTIGRLGRSLGVHLLLASQRLDEGRLRGLDAHLSYRICLKTSTAAESRAVLGVGDAAELTGGPGAALLRTDGGTLTRFRSIHVGAPDPTARLARETTSGPVRRFTSLPTAVVPPIVDPAPPPPFSDTLVQRLSGQGTRAHAIWLPPLAKPPELVELAQIPATMLTAPIGLVDLPFEQRRRPLVIDIGGVAGNIAVVGAAQTGKSATVATVVTALASRHDPRRIQWYCLDFGGGALHVLSTLPHVGSVTGRQDRDRVHRTVGHVMSVLRARERQAAGADGDDGDDYGDVVLVIDGWAVFRAEYTELESAITAIAAQGLSHGVHLLITAGRWADLRPALKDQFGTRIELRLGDPVDSEMDRRQAALVPIGRPGRGITANGHHFVVARADPGAVTADRSWAAPPIRILPDTVEHDALVRRADADAAGIILGLGEDELTPVAVDFTQHTHLMIFGDGECGKTATLRTLCREIVRGAAARPAQLFVIDLRRNLLDTVGGAELTGYAFSTASLAQQLPGLIALLESRLPTAHTTVEQLRSGTWWAGPRVFVVVDDYDLLAATAPDALNGLLRLLPHAADIGFHTVLARRCAGAGRAMFDPLLAQLRDSGCMGLLMNGSPDEGTLIGNNRAAAYPAGRGLLVTRAGRQRVQVGWCPPRPR